MEKININNDMRKTTEKVNEPDNEGENIEVKKKGTKNNEFKGYLDFHDIPGYAPDYKGGRSKYDAQIEYEKNSKLLEMAEKDLENSEIGETHQETKKIIHNEEKEKATALSRFRKIGNSMAAKIAVLSLMLFAKAGESYASNANASDKDLALKNKLELTTDNENNASQENTLNKEGNYFAEYKDFETGVKLEATNYFITDKAEINQENQEKLAEDFSKFLETINDHNFKEIIEKNWVVKGSSDERKTSNWGASNEELTKTRIETVNQVLEKTLANHDFGNNLSSENVAVLKAKKINQSYPMASEIGKENGVTYLTDLENPKTGENYSKQEIENIKKNDQAGYLKMLESCRYTNFELESNYFELAKFDRAHFMVDESNSMEASKYFIANKLKNIEYNKPIMLHNYSEMLNENAIACKDNKEAAEKIKETSKEGSFRERQINSALELVTKLTKENQENGGKYENQIIYIATDEAIQGANSSVLELLKTKADQANIEIKFLLGYKVEKTDKAGNTFEESNVYQLSLDEFIQSFEDLKNSKEAGEKSDLKIDAFLLQEYENSKEALTNFLNNNYRSNEFKALLKAKGFGENTDEMVVSLENYLSGSGNYIKLQNLMDIKKVQSDINSRAIGNISRDAAALSESIKISAELVRDLIEAKNNYEIVKTAVEGMDENNIPSAQGSQTLNVGQFKTENNKTINLPINGINGWQANLYS